MTTTGASTSQPLALSASTSSYLNNFSGKAFCSSSITVLNSTIFTAEVVNRLAFDKIDWIIDTGATDHMVHSVLDFSSITCVSNSFVYLPNGEKVLVTHICTIHFTETLTLIDVLCVPSFTFNLLSISKLNKSQYFYLIFLGSFCFIQDLALWSTMGLGREQNGLYLLDNKYKDLSSIPASTHHHSISTHSGLWHFRLGHPSSGKLELVNKIVSFVQRNKTAHCDRLSNSKEKDIAFLF